MMIHWIAPPYTSFWGKAENVCKKKLIKNPNDIHSTKTLSYIYIQQGKYAAAQILLESLMTRYEHKNVMQLLARVYFNLCYYDKIINLFKNKRNFKDKDVETYYLGYSFIEMGQTRKGIEDIEKYSNYNNKDYKVLWKLANEYFKNGQFDIACERYQEALTLNPFSKELQQEFSLCRKKIFSAKAAP